MKLSVADADLFFKLMWSLQHYVNDQRHIFANVGSVEEYLRLPQSDKIQVRDALWEHPELIDAYVDENPDGFSENQRDMVRKWKRFVAGTFQIVRLLKKHAIFIGKDSKVYGVLALDDRLDAMLLGRPLPIMVHAVLLPFKGKIVYDGLLRCYNVHFGGGVRAALKEEYLAAKKQGRIITTLEAD